MFRTTSAALALLALLAAGCSGEAAPEEGVVGAEPVEASEEAGAPEIDAVEEPLGWGETTTVTGQNGTPLELTPVAVRYVGADEIADEFEQPDAGVFAAVEIEAAAVESAEALAGGAGPGGWSWRLDGQQTSTVDGNTYIAPWAGAVPAFTMDTALLPGEAPTAGVVDFDVSSQGGELAYTDADGVMVRWEAPGGSEGEVTGVEDAL